MAASSTPAARAAGATLTGRLVRSIGDDFAGRRATELTWVATAAGNLTVPLDTVRGIAAGASVRVALSTGTDPGAGAARAPAALIAGVRGGTARVASVTRIEVAGAASGLVPVTPRAAGVHRITVVPIYWDSTTLPSGALTTSKLRKLIAGVNTYWSATTAGKVRVTAKKVHGWQRVAALNGTGCQSDRIEEAVRARIGEVVPDGFHHVLIYFPERAACGWSGLANKPGHVMWINGANQTQVLAHELGHNLGLDHSGALECFTTAAKTLATAYSDHCRRLTYRDQFDIMGAHSQLGQLSAAHLDDLALLPTTAQVTVRGSRSVTLTAVASGSGVRLLRIPNGKRVLLVEYRGAVGMDSYIDDTVYQEGDRSYTWPGTGVVVREMAVDGTIIESWEHFSLDAAPYETDSWWEAPGFKLGQSVRSPDGKVTLRVTAVTRTTATVAVTAPAPTARPSAFSITTPKAAAVLTSPIVDVAWSRSTDAQSALVGVDVVLDGRIVHRVLGWNVQNGPIPLPVRNGRHSLQLVARNAAGLVRGSNTISFTVDTTGPVISLAPRAVLAPGAVSTAAVPVAVGWAAADAGTGIRTQRLVRGRMVTALTGSVRSVRTVAAASARGTANAWTLTATDGVGRSARATGTPVTATVDPQSVRAGSVYRGAWTASRSTSFVGGSEQLSTARGASATYALTGVRSVGLVAGTGPRRGAMAIYVDGALVKRLDLRGTTVGIRRFVWRANWAVAGNHTVRIVNEATPGRPTIGIDALVTLR